MDHPELTVSNLKENSIGLKIKKVKLSLLLSSLFHKKFSQNGLSHITDNNDYLSPLMNATGTAKLVNIFSRCFKIVTILKIYKCTSAEVQLGKIFERNIVFVT